MERLARWIGLLAGVAASAQVLAVTTVDSYAEATGLAVQTGCVDRSSGPGFDCVGSSDYGLYGDDDSSTNGSTVDAGGSLAHPTSQGALNASSARAQTEAWINRVEGRAFATHAGFDNSPPVPGFIRIDSSADAAASSIWSAPVTIAGASQGGGAAIFRVRITGAIDIDHPATIPAAGAEVSYTMHAGAPGSAPPAPSAVFSTNGTFSELVSLFFPFQYNVPLQLNGFLGATVHASGGWPFFSEGGPDGSDAFGDPYSSRVNVEFFGTARVEQLVLPAGATAVGEGGGALPFQVLAVPEPGIYLMLFAGGALMFTIAARRGRFARR